VSKEVDLSRPLSDEDRAYLLQRGRRHLVLQNDRQFENGEFARPDDDDEDEDEIDQEWVSEVEAMNVDQLRAELQRRSLSTSGKKDELQDRLIEDGPKN
jgi:hypothetical protein